MPCVAQPSWCSKRRFVGVCRVLRSPFGVQRDPSSVYDFYTRLRMLRFVTYLMCFVRCALRSCLADGGSFMSQGRLMWSSELTDTGHFAVPLSLSLALLLFPLVRQYAACRDHSGYLNRRHMPHTTYSCPYVPLLRARFTPCVHTHTHTRTQTHCWSMC